MYAHKLNVQNVRLIANTCVVIKNSVGTMKSFAKYLAKKSKKNQDMGAAMATSTISAFSNLSNRAGTHSRMMMQARLKMNLAGALAYSIITYLYVHL